MTDTVAQQLKTDIATAMKAGERDRVGALRLILSEVQKAEKDGSGDQLAVLRRERKRRLDAAAQFDAGGRPELAKQEEGEAALIAAYLPTELSDRELDEIVATAVVASGATTPQQLGVAMKAAIAAVDGRADGKRVAARVREALA